MMFTRVALRATHGTRSPIAWTRRCESNSPKGFNGAIIDLLKRHMEEEDTSVTRNEHKVRAFSRAINVLSQIDYPIRTAAEASVLDGIGPGITKRIEAFLSGTDYVPSRPHPEPRLRDTKHQLAISDLKSVHGIGNEMAKKLVDAGCMSVADLHQPQYNTMLTPTMQVGLKYVKHLHVSTRRDLAETAIAFIRDNISPKFDFHLVGSYRRGASTSSDIDIVIFHPCVPIPTPSPPLSSTSSSSAHRSTSRTKRSSVKERASPLLMRDVVKVLEDRGFIAASLSSGPRRWKGVVRLPERTADGTWEEKTHRRMQISRTEGMYRRVDMNLVPQKSRGAAFLAFTGDVEFVRHLRGIASSLGMHLNEFGLWRWQAHDPHANDDDVPEDGYWELVKSESEQEILEELALEYVEPERRNFGFVFGQEAEKRRKKAAR